MNRARHPRQHLNAIADFGPGLPQDIVADGEVVRGSMLNQAYSPDLRGRAASPSRVIGNDVSFTLGDGKLYGALVDARNQPSPQAHRPGFVVLRSDAAIAANDAVSAWEEQGTALRDAWKGQPSTPMPTLADAAAPKPPAAPPDRTANPEQARALADAAWEERRRRECEAWRGAGAAS